eukprot:scaffold443353_cov19-Prasinocladus_malaysianus.AAC.1
MHQSHPRHNATFTRHHWCCQGQNSSMHRNTMQWEHSWPGCYLRWVEKHAAANAWRAVAIVAVNRWFVSWRAGCAAYG